MKIALVLARPTVPQAEIRSLAESSGLVCETLDFGVGSPLSRPADAYFIHADDDQVIGSGLLAALIRRAQERACPVILFGRPRPGIEIARFLDSGVDDYWSLPLRQEVAGAYFRAILRRLAAGAGETPAAAAGVIEIDRSSGDVSLDGRRVRLRRKEIELFCLFVRCEGRSLSRRELMELVWGQEWFGTTRTIDFHIAQLRRKLGRLGRMIETLPGVGYRLSARPGISYKFLS